MLRTKESERIRVKRQLKNKRAQILAKFGNKCVRCGFADPRALQIDHVNGGGSRETKSLRGNTWRKYQTVLRDTTNRYQLLCANCNWIKRSENGEVSSQKTGWERAII